MSEKWYCVKYDGKVCEVMVEKETDKFIYIEGKNGQRTAKDSDNYEWYDKSLEKCYQKAVAYNQKKVEDAERNLMWRKKSLQDVLDRRFVIMAVAGAES